MFERDTPLRRGPAPSRRRSRGSRSRASAPWPRSGSAGRSGSISLVPTKASKRADQGDPAAVLDVDQAPSSTAMLMTIKHDVDQRAGGRRLGAADPADRAAALLLGCDQRERQQQTDDERPSTHRQELQRGRVAEHRHVVRALREPYAQGRKGARIMIAPPTSARIRGRRRWCRCCSSGVTRSRRSHARSTTLAPSRPWGRKTRTRISRTKAQTSFQAEPPNWPGM